MFPYTFDQLMENKARVVRHVDVREWDACWPWTGYTYAGGYGQIHLARTGRRAHRLVWEIANEQLIPDGLIILHACDNPRCCNPRHLSLGTHSDNAWDKASKGRCAGQEKTHCRNGHAYLPDNLRFRGGRRACRRCTRASDLRQLAKRHERAGRGE